MEEFKKILVPFDDSKHAKMALKKAISLAKLIDGEITLIHVIEPYVFPLDDMVIQDYSSLVDAIQKENEKKVRTMLENHVLEGKKEGVKIYISIIEGNVSNEIIDISKKFDLIIIGTMGHNILSELLLGSTAEKVARHAYCPVMLVRENKKK